MSTTGGSGTLWDKEQNYIRVILKDVEVEAHVGLHPWEQHEQRPSRLLINIELFAHIESTLHNSSSIIDYDQIRNTLKTWPSRPRTPLLETLVEELIELSFKNSRVEACRISILKPDIFNEAAGAGVEIYRVRKP